MLSQIHHITRRHDSATWRSVARVPHLVPMSVTSSLPNICHGARRFVAGVRRFDGRACEGGCDARRSSPRRRAHGWAPTTPAKRWSGRVLAWRGVVQPAKARPTSPQLTMASDDGPWVAPRRVGRAQPRPHCAPGACTAPQPGWVVFSTTHLGRMMAPDAVVGTARGVVQNG